MSERLFKKLETLNGFLRKQAWLTKPIYYLLDRWVPTETRDDLHWDEEADLEILEQKHVLRKGIATCQAFITEARENEADAGVLIDGLERSVLAIRTQKKTDTSIKSLVQEAIGSIEAQFMHEGCSGLPAARDKLVHDPASHSNEFVFGLLAKFGKLDAIHLEAGIPEQGETGRDLDRS